jgi:hypothetical protein
VTDDERSTSRFRRALRAMHGNESFLLWSSPYRFGGVVAIAALVVCVVFVVIILI